VSGRQVTVTPTDEQGRTLDVQTYSFPTTPADTQAPTPPTVTGTAPTSGRIDLAWSGATDNVGVTGYRVYREGTLLATTTTASYSDTTVAPSTAYSYEVTGLDAAGNESARSAPPTTVTTPGAPDTTAPSQPGSFSAAATSSSTVNLAWSASTDNVAVTGYKVYRNSSLLSTINSGAPLPTTYTDETASPSTLYTYAVSAIDAAGNESTQASASVTTPAGSGGTSTLTFAPTDDATVDQSQPTVNFGTATRLTVDSSPVNNMLMKFTVAGTNGCAIASAKLRVTVGNATDDKSVHGGEFFAAANSTWLQSSVNWNTAPATTGAQLASLGAVAVDTSYLVDVTPAVTGDGTLTIRASSTNSDGARYYSKEGSATQAPQLQVTCR
jgi:chitodextrinase